MGCERSWHEQSKGSADASSPLLTLTHPYPHPHRQVQSAVQKRYRQQIKHGGSDSIHCASPLLTLTHPYSPYPHPILTAEEQRYGVRSMGRIGPRYAQRQMQRDNGYLFEIRPVSSPFLTLTHPYPHPVPKAEKRIKSSEILLPSGQE
jgi:hypothetical protein